MTITNSKAVEKSEDKLEEEMRRHLGPDYVPKEEREAAIAALLEQSRLVKEIGFVTLVERGEFSPTE